MKIVVAMIAMLLLTCFLVGCGGSSEEEKLGRDIDALIAESKTLNKEGAAGIEKMEPFFKKMEALAKRIDALPKDKQTALRDRLFSGKK